MSNLPDIKGSTFCLDLNTPDSKASLKPSSPSPLYIIPSSGLYAKGLIL